MKKLATLFTDSYNEFKNVKVLTATGMFGAASLVLGYFTIAVGDYVKIGFSTIANQFVYYLFGPVVGGVFGGAMDILKYLIKPTGGYFFGFTLVPMIAGVIYGICYYKKPISLWRTLVAELIVAIFCNMLLGTYFLSIILGKGFFVLFPLRALKNIIMWPIHSMLFYTIGKTLEASGVFRNLKSLAYH
ncbi:MAG: folate family ECF transporter S component [Lachnospiraceae bacterium]|jgi:ECF transporter S component (folate family)|nr:folate family ECF transporter S component [Lachnospiraceae bacterium]